MEMMNKTGVHFVLHLLPQSLVSQPGSAVTTSGKSGEMVLDVPAIRTQLRGMQLLPAVRYYRQGMRASEARLVVF